VHTSCVVIDFNNVVQYDLLFWTEHVVIHLLDTCLRRSAVL
jgi:hypothetical protein